MTESNSAFKLISIGVVAKDKHDDSKSISAVPLELFPFIEGPITHEHETITRKGVDADGTPYTVNLQRGMAISCMWKADGNRMTSPNVVKGEQVEIYQSASDGRYWWKSMDRENHLRRTETVVNGYMASGAEPGTNVMPNDNNMYTSTIDTKAGHVTVKTSNDNGELAKYTAQLNGKEGHASLADDSGNTIQMNSDGKSIIAKLADGTQFTMTSGNITLKATTIVLDGNVKATGKITGPDATIDTLDCATLHGVAIDQYKK